MIPFLNELVLQAIAKNEYMLAKTKAKFFLQNIVKPQLIKNWSYEDFKTSLKWHFQRKCSQKIETDLKGLISDKVQTSTRIPKMYFRHFSSEMILLSVEDEKVRGCEKQFGSFSLPSKSSVIFLKEQKEHLEATWKLIGSKCSSMWQFLLTSLPVTCTKWVLSTIKPIFVLHTLTLRNFLLHYKTLV